MSTTVNDILYKAARLAGALNGPGRSLSQSEKTEYLAALVSLNDSWSADRLNIFTTTIVTLTFASYKQSYTIGIDPAGLLTADFAVARPAMIERANLISQVGSPQEVHTPMDILTKEEWAQIRVPATSSAIPRKLYCDYGAPLATLYLYPYPSAAAKLELFVWSILPAYASTSDVFNLPQGYRRALEYNLAVEINAVTPGAVMKPQVPLIASETKALLQAKNAPAPLLAGDPALVGAHRSNWNYLTGE